MTALVTINAQNTLPALADEMQAAHDYAVAEKSEATRRAYRSDYAAFTAWCAVRSLDRMPAAPDTVAAYLASRAAGGLKPSSLQRAAAAIAYAHKLAGFDAPTNSERVKATLRGIRRTVGAAKVQKAPLTAPRLQSLLAALPDGLRGIRDRALLAIGFAGAFRRSELAALTVVDLEFTAAGMRVTIRKSKTDQDGTGQTIAIPNGTSLRPVQAVRAWIEAAGITEGPIFRAINKGGRVTDGALTGESIAAMVKFYADAAGFDAEQFAGHSLRSGFLTSAAEAGANIFKMMEVSRHRSVDTLRGYVRRADLFKEHAGSAFL